MLSIKTGVPGSGKTLSMAAELLDMIKAAAKGSDPRPVYTNITGLAIPHVAMRNWEPGTKREDGVLYTTDWRECPPGALVVIDEAYLYGYGAAATQAVVPDYIRDLAIHRKDYSLDIVLIAQHPKLLHVQARRQVGKHQHYRRLFGWGTAVCYEWDQCQDNLSATKTAVVTRFRYPKSVYTAYKSAEVHTKPTFKKPWFIWIPVALVPLAAWALPTGFNVMQGAMTGKGISTSQAAQKTAVAAPTPLAAPVPPKAEYTGTNYPPGFVPAPGQTPAPQTLPAPPVEQVAAGCVATPAKGCKCFDTTGKVVPTVPEMCPDTAAKPATDLQLLRDTPTILLPSQQQPAAISLGGTSRTPS